MSNPRPPCHPHSSPHRRVAWLLHLVCVRVSRSTVCLWGRDVSLSRGREKLSYSPTFDESLDVATVNLIRRRRQRRALLLAPAIALLLPERPLVPATCVDLNTIDSATSMAMFRY